LRNKTGCEHFGFILRRLGISERLAIVAIGLTILLQYIFLAKLWEGYLVNEAGDTIHSNVVLVGALISISGAFTIALLSIRHWHNGKQAARRLERSATNDSFKPIRSALQKLLTQSTLHSEPDLLYTPKNALALEVREFHCANKAIIIGLDQRGKQRMEPDIFDAKLGHEISHLELAATNSEILARQIVAIHFRIFFWLFLVFLLLLGFIDRTGIERSEAFGGIIPSFDTTLYVQLAPQIAALALSSLVVFIYSYFFVVRREHVHDVRGSQLAGNDTLATKVFSQQEDSDLFLMTVRGVRDFFRLHPNVAARKKIVIDRDMILLSTLLYPAIVAGIQPMTLLLTAGWRIYFDIEEHWWNLGLTILSGFLLYSVLKADIVRFGIGVLIRPGRYLFRIPIYALVVGFATQIPGAVLKIIYGMRKGYSSEYIFDWILHGLSSGGVRVVLMIAGTLLLLVYLTAIRVAAMGEHRGMNWPLIEAFLAALIVVGAFTISSLSDTRFILVVSATIVTISITYAVSFVLLNSCPTCRKRRLSALLLSTRCSCGHEHFQSLRRWIKEPYDRHLIVKS